MTASGNTATNYLVENGSEREKMTFVECAKCKENIPLLEKNCECGGSFVHACESTISKFLKGEKIEIKEIATTQRDDGTIVFYFEC